MRVALYYPWLYLKSGAERVIVKLIEHSRHDWTLFTGRYERESTYPELGRAQIVELDGLSVKRSIAATARNCLRLLRRRLPIEEFDALVIVCEGLGDLVALRNASKPTLNVCLTPLRIAFDEVYRRQYFEGRPAPGRWAVRAGAAAFRLVDRIAWRRYDRIFFISEEARRRAIRGGLPGAERGKILHVGLGVAPSAPGERFDSYFLLPGRIMWTKNVELAIEAFRAFSEEAPDRAEFRLVVAGFVDAKSRPYLEKLRRMAAGLRVEFRVDPTDAELEQLYRSCRAVLFTALNEDWGIVPLEGMAFGKPPIAVRRGGPLESIDHGESGFLEEPEPAAFARRMREFALDPEIARSMGRIGRERVRRFDWGRFAARIDDEIEALAGAAAAAPASGGAGNRKRTASLSPNRSQRE